MSVVRSTPTTVAALVWAAVAGAAPGAEAQLRATGPHGDLVCAACHDGVLSDRSLPHVSAGTCEACHDVRAIPTGALHFDHGQHQEVGGPDAGCPSCHTHAVGTQELSPGLDGCGLCHRGDVDGSGTLGCRACHDPLPPTVRTSQGVELAHGVYDWMDDSCLRCHYQVSSPPGSTGRCADCHRQDGEGLRREEAEALHTSHTQTSCGACHELGQHRIQAMSAVVELDCGECHATPHALPPASPLTEAGVCNTCHAGTHAAQQRLLLGVAGGDFGPVVSPKFLSGLSCTSCHDGAGAPTPRRVDWTCAGCHRPEYARIAGWWTTGGEARAAAVTAYLAGARSALVEDDPSAETGGLDMARAWLELVADGGAAHNPVLSHRLLEAVRDQAVDAYRAAGAIVPFPPVMGSEPRAGRCSYCHYDMTFDASEALLGPPDAFHRELRGARTAAPRERHP